MGYYTGNGEITGGGSTISVYENFIWYGAHNVYQRRTATNTRRAGVSLATAQAEVSTMAMSSHQFNWTSSGASHYHISPNCYGTQKQVGYSQIGGSNLYELKIENSTIQARMDNGSWVG